MAALTEALIRQHLKNEMIYSCPVTLATQRYIVDCHQPSSRVLHDNYTFQLTV